MNDLMNELIRPAWWVTVVLAGLLVNLASAYAKPRLDRLLSRSSERWRQRVEAAQSLESAELQRLVADERERIWAAFDALTARVRAITFFCISIALLGCTALTTSPLIQGPSPVAGPLVIPDSVMRLVAVLALLSSSVAAVLGLSELLEAIRLDRRLRVARRIARPASTQPGA